MTVLTTFPATAATGDILDAGYLNASVGASLAQDLATKRNLYVALSGVNEVSGNGFFTNQPYNTYAANTLISGNGASTGSTFVGSPYSLVAGRNGFVFQSPSRDSFTDTSFDTTRYASGPFSGAGLSANISYKFYEASGLMCGAVQIAGSLAGAGRRWGASIVTSGSSDALMFSGNQSFEVIVPYHWYGVYAGGQGSISGTCQLSFVNSVSAVMATSTAYSTSAFGASWTINETGYFRIVYNAASGTVNAWVGSGTSGVVESQIGSNLGTATSYPYLAMQVIVSGGTGFSSGAHLHAFWYGMGYYSGGAITGTFTSSGGAFVPRIPLGVLTSYDWSGGTIFVPGSTTAKIKTNQADALSSNDSVRQVGYAAAPGSNLIFQITSYASGVINPLIPNAPVLTRWNSLLLTSGGGL